MMNPREKELYRFFLDKAKHLQNEIDMEIRKIGGEGMLISREDLLHWVYYSRDMVKTYYTICNMLEDKALGFDAEQVIRSLRETVREEQYEIERLRRKQEEQKRALKELRSEAEYYRLALEVLEK